MKVQNKEHLERLQSRTGLLAEEWLNSLSMGTGRIFLLTDIRHIASGPQVST